MTHGGVALLDVNFQTEERLALKTLDYFVNPTGAALNTTPLDARIRVISEEPHPNGFKNVHDSMVDDTVRIVRKTINNSFFRLVDREHVIRRGLERLCQQGFMQSQQILLSVLVVNLDPVCVRLPPSRIFIGEAEVF